MKFTYASGQRPLDGYTVKRGIGRGGFGEVFYALSDGGKEVALKLVRCNLDIELRGMAQCLNLKHPNLLALYDLKTDAQGDHWVVMEYVAGEPLSAVLNRHPQGLAPELAQQWFLAMARAVSYLHDHGIVHRDLKPGNIFLENGLIKVGDYGLSKFISSSQRTAQTQSVGTVHYMAPEISTGNYNKQIDVYAAGVILYEMLTGRVPFEGESAGEILMKHLTSPPDLSKVPAAYVPVVARALAKDPAQRFASMAEMARALEGIRPASAPILETVLPVASTNGKQAEPAPLRVPARPEPVPNVLPAVSSRGQVAELCGSLALTALFALVAYALWASLLRVEPIVEIAAAFFLTVACCWAVLIPAKVWSGRAPDPWMRRVVMLILGMCVGLGSFWLGGYSPADLRSERAGSTRRTWWEAPVHDQIRDVVVRDRLRDRAGIAQLGAAVSYFGLALFALRWWKMAERRRSQRFSLGPVLAAGFWGLFLLLVWNEPWRGTVVLVTTAAIVQLVSPWEPPPPPSAKRVRLRYA
jgi:hypothetical protein